MQQRVSKLEEQAAALVVDVAVIKSNYATRHDVEGLRVEMYKMKDDIRTAMASQTSWLFSAIFVALGLGLSIAKIIF